MLPAGMLATTIYGPIVSISDSMRYRHGAERAGPTRPALAARGTINTFAPNWIPTDWRFMIGASVPCRAQSAHCRLQITGQQSKSSNKERMRLQMSDTFRFLFLNMSRQLQFVVDLLGH